MDYAERTILYGIESRGEGSVLIESLTSYIIRLSEAHLVNLCDLLVYGMAPLLKKDYLINSVHRGGNRFYDGAHFLNGFGTNSKDILECLYILSGQKLEDLTLKPFSKIFSTRYLIRKNMAWCPKCLECNHYYPLIWSLTSYTVCISHSVLLQDKCIVCNKPIPFLHRQSRVGLCPYCKHSHFGLNNNENIQIKDIYISKDLEKLFKYVRNGHLFNDQTTMQTNFQEIINSRFAGTTNHFAKYIGISKTTMWDWCKGKSRPSLKQVLEISFKLGVSCLELYNKIEINKIKDLGVTGGDSQRKEKREKIVICKDKVKNYLSKIEDQIETYQPITNIAKELNCSTKYLYTNFSEYCKRISFNNRRIKENIEKERTKEILVLIKEQFIKETVNGIPTRNKIEEKLQMPCLFKNRTFKDYYFELCLNHGFLS
ncbi:TniQ family protein [Peribacillus simplex]|uniref:TniQ family protein n=1 Tax=Peribacillus simplex TaxID=1478 RepID=UPI0024C171BC|nr:TniQ family protein [Peribacillus simplex]WHY97356.1 TniQ family protein [Peribacillus simplex]